MSLASEMWEFTKLENEVAVNCKQNRDRGAQAETDKPDYLTGFGWLGCVCLAAPVSDLRVCGRA